MSKRAFFPLCLILISGCNLYRDIKPLPLSQAGFERVRELNGEENWQGVPYTLRVQSGDCEDAAAVEAVAAIDRGYKTWLVEIGHYIDYWPDPDRHVSGVDQDTHIVVIYTDGSGVYYSSGMNRVDCWHGGNLNAVATSVALCYGFNFYQAFPVTPEIRVILMKDSRDISTEMKKAGVHRDYYKFVFLDPDLEKKREENKKENGIK